MSQAFPASEPVLPGEGLHLKASFARGFSDMRDKEIRKNHSVPISAPHGAKDVWMQASCTVPVCTEQTADSEAPANYSSFSFLFNKYYIL